MPSDIVKSLKILVGQGAIIESVEDDHMKLLVDFTSLSDNEKKTIIELEQGKHPYCSLHDDNSLTASKPDDPDDYELEHGDEDGYESEAELPSESLDESISEAKKSGLVSTRAPRTPDRLPTGTQSGGYYNRTSFEITNLHPTREGGIVYDTVPADAVLVNLYQQLSNKVLSALYPSVWTKNGRFNSRYRHLQGTSKSNKDRTIPNKDGLQWCILFDKVFQCQLISNPVGWTRIVVSVTRSSNRSPTFGRDGMAQRATTAANAWISLSPQDPALLVVQVRTGVSSNTGLDTPQAAIQEILRLLKAASARPGSIVEILSVSIDGFCTNPPSLAWLSQQYPSITIRIVIVVPSTFPDSMTIYRESSNGIRYGEFSVRHRHRRPEQRF
ncbi:hypothetical protein FALBO_6044 [Fusarium albosuccineum]|uniref:Uncharacterized protein n=1 Tax=Fusarium albosuccineum TaxID=1237068 RepID=A0A8H4LEY0_9HYPO|nr:hypothetical protein FALBO_6044 [Fusarium albosuccineum]